MEIKTTKQYDRAEKKYHKKHYPIEKVADCVDAIIAQDKEFLKKHKDHKVGTIREIHIDRNYNDDWLLIYKINNHQLVLLLIDLGNHDSLNRIIKSNKAL